MDPQSTKKNSGVPSKLPKSPLVMFFILIAVFVSIGSAVFIAVSGKKFNLPFQMGKKEPEITLKTENKNPFDIETQYVNPFDTSKSTFYNLKKKEEEK